VNPVARWLEGLTQMLLLSELLRFLLLVFSGCLRLSSFLCILYMVIEKVYDSNSLPR
jgi:hypothetical protein